MASGIPYDLARQRWQVGATPPKRADEVSVPDLLKGYHPDHGPRARVSLAVGVNRGDPCQPDFAAHLQANALIDDVHIAGAQLVTTDVLVIGGGGGGCAAALTAAKDGARVILATKLRLGDSNTVMAEGASRRRWARTTAPSATSRTRCGPATSAASRSWWPRWRWMAPPSSAGSSSWA